MKKPYLITAHDSERIVVNLSTTMASSKAEAIANATELVPTVGIRHSDVKVLAWEAGTEGIAPVVNNFPKIDPAIAEFQKNYWIQTTTIKNMNQNAQNFGAFVGETITSFLNADSNRDGKLQAGEIASVVLSILISGVKVFDTFDEALAELRNNGSPARVALLNGLKAKFDLEDDTLESLIEDTLFFIEDGIAITERWMAFRKVTEPAPTLDIPQV
jgi:hypothetical protein